METCALADKECVPCKGGVAPLKGAELDQFSRQLEGWQVVNDHHLSKSYKFPNFVTALAFVNRIGELAEKVGHHPDLTLAWGKVGVEIWTHKINGLTESDFVFAAKTDKFLKEPK
jgi:4a-hydroxytetrahydrobiopterin dehydratase